MSQWSAKIIALAAKRAEIDAELAAAQEKQDERVIVAYESWSEFLRQTTGNNNSTQWSELSSGLRDAWRRAVERLDEFDRDHTSEEPITEQDWSKFDDIVGEGKRESVFRSAVDNSTELANMWDQDPFQESRHVDD